MTKEEANKILKYQHDNGNMEEAVRQALAIAIEALTHDIRTETHECVKETHDSDLISRADAVHGWIPIKDGLPKPYKDVMATVWFEDYGDDDDAFEIAFGFLNKFGKWDLRLADGSECIKGFYVQAWQPLPTPYKGGDTE